MTAVSPVGPGGADGGRGERPQGLDWAGLMRAGLHGLGLKPREFWDLTPAELALMLGVEPGGGAGTGMNRARLDELAARFPDAGPRAGQGPGVTSNEGG